ncbi:hypothetical protein [Sorangium sp. So ce381]|uniref:hypothetical protein n=1 Tax=Sorangium sp. So ce381 TaxID=3133307 RepID=UPI003F5C2926
MYQEAREESTTQRGEQHREAHDCSIWRRKSCATSWTVRPGPSSMSSAVPNRIGPRSAAPVSVVKWA